MSHENIQQNQDIYSSSLRHIQNIHIIKEILTLLEMTDTEKDLFVIITIFQFMIILSSFFEIDVPKRIVEMFSFSIFVFDFAFFIKNDEIH